MNPLPWLVVHGPLVWQIGLAALALGALAVAFARPRLAARRANAAARDRLGAPAQTLTKPSDGMRVTLTGKLVVEGPCQRFEDGGEAAAASAAYAPQGPGGAWITGLNLRAAKLALALAADEAVVALEGEVEVVAGSREVRRGLPLHRLPRAAQDRVAAGFKVGAPHFRDHVTLLRSLAPGDRVRVSGVLRRESLAGEAAGYRAAAERWSLVPDGEAAHAAAGATATAGLCLASEDAPRIAGPGIGWYSKHLAGGLLLFATLFGLGGEIAFASAESAREALAITHVGGDPQTPGPAGKAAPADAGLFVTALAAATPIRRMEAIERLADALDLRHDEDAALVERRAALHELHGGCVDAARALARQGFLERGAETAARCGDHAFAAKVFYAAGDFARASDAWMLAEKAPAKHGAAAASEADARFGVRVHLLAGRLDRAAMEARALGDALRTEHASESRAALARCLADALEAKAGAKDALARLGKERDQPIYPACAILLADLHQGKDRLDLIHGLTSFQSSAREVPMRWLDLLEQEADPTVAPAGRTPLILENPSLLVMNAGLAVQEMLPAVESALAEATAKDARPDDPRRATRARAAAMAASFAAATGDDEGARRFAKIAADSAEPPPEDGYRHHADHDAWDAARAATFGAAIELGAGDAARARALLAVATQDFPTFGARQVGVLVAFRHQPEPTALMEGYGNWTLVEEGVDRALKIAARGDGAELAAFLREPASEPGAYLRLGAPMLKTGQDQVLRWIRVGYRMPGWFRSPSDQLVHWSVLASTASTLGDDALAAQLRDRAARFRRAVLDRNTAVPLAVLERL